MRSLIFAVVLAVVLVLVLSVGVGADNTVPCCH
jgi:hypothetical protein